MIPATSFDLDQLANPPSLISIVTHIMYGSKNSISAQ